MIYSRNFVHRSKLGILLFLVLAGVICSSESHAQFKFFQKISDTQGNFKGGLEDGDDFGESVIGLGDLDLDGTLDMAVSAEDDDDGGSNRGALYILFMNPDGTVNAHQKISQTAGGFTGQLDDEDEFGNFIASLGDVDGDGITDIAVSAINDDDGGDNRGAIWILFLNRDGTVKDQQKISDTQGGFTGTIEDNNRFGSGLEGLGDFDNDGIPDLAVGYDNNDDGGSNRGAVWLLMLNSDGTVKRHYKISDTVGGFTGELDNDDKFGQSVASLGDFDGDGVIDIAVGAEADDDGGTDRGAVWLLMMNSDGTVKSHYKISDTAGGFTGGLDDVDNFGHAVEALGDVDGDGVTDIAVGAEYDTDSGKQRGATWILYLNADGTVKSHFKINYATPGFEGQLDRFDEFGQDIANIGDLDGDGIIDMVSAADGDDDGGDHRGSVYVFFLEAGSNQAPVLAAIGNKSVIEGQLLTFDVSAQDPDGPAPLVLTHSALPDGAGFVDNGDGTGTFTWTPAVGDSAASPYALTVTATEDGGSGLSDQETFSINVHALSAIGSMPMESGFVAGVDENWITVNLTGTYNSPVVLASPNYDEASPPLVVRIRNAGADSFDMRVVNVNNTAANIAGVDVYYFVVDAGVYTLAANGIQMEAVRFNSTVTDRQELLGRPAAQLRQFLQRPGGAGAGDDGKRSRLFGVLEPGPHARGCPHPKHVFCRQACG